MHCRLVLWLYCSAFAKILLLFNPIDIEINCPVYIGAWILSSKLNDKNWKLSVFLRIVLLCIQFFLVLSSSETKTNSILVICHIDYSKQLNKIVALTVYFIQFKCRRKRNRQWTEIYQHKLTNPANLTIDKIYLRNTTIAIDTKDGYFLVKSHCCGC